MVKSLLTNAVSDNKKQNTPLCSLDYEEGKIANSRIVFDKNEQQKLLDIIKASIRHKEVRSLSFMDGLYRNM